MNKSPPPRSQLYKEILDTYITKDMSPVARRNSTEILSYVAVFGIGISVCAYFYAKGREGTVPDYVNDPNTWVSYEASGTENKRADLFYAHPTTAAGLIRWNIAWEDMGDICTGPVAGDPDLIKGQAAAWSEESAVYAPKYRQQGFLAMGVDLESNDNNHEKMKASLDIALHDLEHAFDHFLSSRPDKTRPFIVAAHSQGAILMSRVLATRVEGTQYASKLVAAYLAGAYLPLDLFGTVFKQDLHACTSSTDTQCIIAYDTRTASFKPESMNHIIGSIGVWPHHIYWLLHDKYCPRPHGTDDVGKERLQINPMTWTTEVGGVHLGASLTSLMVKLPQGYKAGDKLIPPIEWGKETKTTKYSVEIPNPDTWWPGASHAGGEGNLHPVDVQFWFYNIRENVKQRIDTWYSKHR